MNIFVLDRNYNKIGILSNEGVNPKAPYFDDLYTQELDTGADVFYFSTLATYYAQDIIEIGNHVVFEFNNRQKMFVISSLEFEHKDGMNVIGVYSEGAGFELLEKYKKDISIEGDYKKFLGEILADTDWKYTVSDSLSGLSQKVEYTEEKNIYAILQDSIQTYQGVELEFITDYRDGAPTKTIRAYGNGERGSFVGKRFEYGVNVKGIVKTQNVSNTKDENVIFNEGLVVIDGLQVEISYDVDFALRSEEVPELNIGDAHYIIDNDFNPPMQIKGRIGKIEISFSDPTRNKVYLANFKKITGSKSDDTNEDDVKDIVDDVLSDPDSHMHCSLISRDYDPDYLMTFGYLPNVIGSGSGCTAALFFKDFELTYTMTSRYDQVHWLSVTVARNDDFVGEYTDDYTVDRYYAAELYNSSGHLIPSFRGKQDIGSSEKHWRNLYVDNINGNPILGGDSKVDSITFSNGTRIVQASNGGISVKGEDGDGAKLNVFGELYVTEKIKCELGMEANTLNIKTIQFSDGTTLTSANGLGNDGESPGLGIPEGVITYTQDPIPGNGYRLDFNADRTYVNDLLIANDGMNVIGDLNVLGNILLNGKPIAGDGNPDDPSNPGEGTIPEGDTITVKKIIGGNAAEGERPKYVEIEDALAVKKIFHPEGDGSVEWESDMDVTGTLSVYQDTHISGDLYVYGQIINENSDGNLNTLNGVIEYIQSENSAMYLGDSFVSINDNTYLDGNLLVTGNLIGADVLENVKGIDVEEIYVDKITGRGAAAVPTVNFDGNIKVSGIVHYGGLVNDSDRSLKENIRYIDDLVKITNDDLLEKADLHDFIVNQVNLCEYNFIGDTADKIGFIANDYEGTKVGDKIVSRQGEDNTLAYDVNNLLFATIGALQEEVRIKDEKIASLEARLAKIEEMLGINNN